MGKSLYDPKSIVAKGYDSVRNKYLELIESMGLTVRDKYLKVLTDRLPEGAQVLDLGCGAGVPMTKQLSGRFKVTGVDISKEQLLLATSNVSETSFVLADMTFLCFSASTFDAVVAFYSITHVPRDEHYKLFNNIYRLIKPDGLLLATLGFGDLPDTIESDWLGAPMFFSHFDGETNVSLLKKAGFEILSAKDEKELEYGKPICFRWIVARKSANVG